MSFFEDVFKQLFPQKTDKKYPYILLDEEIQRSEKQQTSYQKWLSEEQQTQLLQPIQRAIAFKTQGIEEDIKVHLFNSQYANGFAVTYTEIFDRVAFLFLFEYFKDKVLTLGYDLNLKQRTLTDFKDYIESKEKYYLKPRKISRKFEYPLPQLYGNILIECILIDDKPSYIKILSTIYQDSMFEAPHEYQEFFDLLFN